MQRSITVFLILAIGGFFTQAARATTTLPCADHVFLPRNPIQAAQTGANGLTLFIQDADCPAPGFSTCRSVAIPPGAPVIVAYSLRDPACVGFVNPNGHAYFGWVAGTALNLADQDAAPIDWVGSYNLGTALISIGQITLNGKPIDRRLGISGSIHIDERRPRSGSFRGHAAHNGDVVTLTGDDSVCQLNFRRVGAYLLVQDNGMCGDPGVSFSGPYRWKPETP